MPRFFLSLLSRSAAALAAVACTLSPAFTQSQTDLTTPTDWWHLTSATPAEVTARINLGYRLVDLEVVNDSPFTLAASFVRNTGDYAKTWWWYTGESAFGVTTRLNQNNARIIDLEPYETSAGLRYAVIMIRNTGQDFAPNHGWRSSLTANQVFAEITANQTRRIIDVEPYTLQGQTRYAYVWIENSGQNQTPWWYLLNADPQAIANVVSQNNARIIDLERQSGGFFSAILTPEDGKSWRYFSGISATSIETYTSQFASRVIDIEPYNTAFGRRYDMVIRQNDNDLAIEANEAMRRELEIGAASGLFLRRLDVSQSQAGVQELTAFEPAGLIKLAHHFTAMLRVSVGLDSLSAQVTEETGTSGTCPSGSNPVTKPLWQVLRDMMESSSNTATEAIRSRYSTPTILGATFSFGAIGIELNHILGCLCGNTRNKATLFDFSQLHRAVATGALASSTGDFYSLMSNGSEFGLGQFGTATVLSAALGASSLNAAERTAFQSALRFAHKGGAYTCSGSSDAHRSRGAYVAVPFRSGCAIEVREYFIGAWVNDAATSGDANNGVGAGITTLYREVIERAVESWEAAGCSAFGNYCQANPNSTGQTGRCTYTGTSLLALDDLVLRGTSMPRNSFGFLIVSGTSGFVANPGGSEGNLCLGGNIGRYSNFVSSTGSNGELSLAFDPNAVPNPSGPPMYVESGDTLYFQWWSRDQASGGAATSNFTNGLRVTFI